MKNQEVKPCNEKLQNLIFFLYDFNNLKKKLGMEWQVVLFSTVATRSLRGHVPHLHPWTFQNLKCKIKNLSISNTKCFLVTSFLITVFENHKDNNGIEGIEVAMYLSSFFLVIWYVFTFYRHEICLLKIFACLQKWFTRLK